MAGTSVVLHAQGDNLGPVFLTPRAYEAAQTADIASVWQDNVRADEVRQLTGVPPAYLPAATIVRWHVGINLPTFETDQLFSQAVDPFRYYTADDIPVTGEGAGRTVTAEQLRAALLGGRTILELTIKNWDNLGSVLAEAFFDTKEIGDFISPKDALRRAETALGAVAGGILGMPLTGRQRAIKRAASIQPYRITRHPRKAIAAR